MKSLLSKRILAGLLSFAMLLTMVVVFTVAGSADNGSYTLSMNSLKAFAQGKMEDGEYVKAGTDNYFTVIYSAKAKVESNSKTFSDGTAASQRIAWGDKSYFGDSVLNVVMIKTGGASTVKLWWGGGDANRNPAVFKADGSILAKDETATVKNDLYISEFTIPDAGIYYIGNLGGSNYFYHLEVNDPGKSTSSVERADWSNVAAPTITSATDNGNGKIIVNVNAEIGDNGADELLVSMYRDGKLIKTKGSVIERGAHTISFTPMDSGTHTFKAEILRAGEESKASAEELSCSFIYPLQAPRMQSATSKGDGKIELIWSSVHEATSYVIYQDDVKIGETQSITYMATNLTIDKEYSFRVSAVRGSEEISSSSLSAVATKEAKIAWTYTVYGPSASESKNSMKGSINDDGWVQLSSTDNGGKIQPTSVDGLALYYTAIPTAYNFTIRAKVKVDRWSLSNGQEGFGLMALDRIPTPDDAYNYWNNSYLAGSTKIEYKYDAENEEILDNKILTYDYKYSMKLGIGVVSRTGVTKELLPLFGDQDTATINANFLSKYYSLETIAVDRGLDSGTYNVIGNYSGETAPEGTVDAKYLVTEYIMEINKSNTGYKITYYNAETKEKIREVQYYSPDALNMIDENFVYVGFFTSRNVTATFSDVELSTILASEDEERKYPPITYITPKINVNSASVTTKANYELIADPEVAGTLTVIYNDRTLVSERHLERYERFRMNIRLDDFDDNMFRLEFTPDPDQDLGEFTELEHKRTVVVTHDVMYNRGNYHRKTLYISPDARYDDVFANGTRENPFNIVYALENASPGQTLVLMEGTYYPFRNEEDGQTLKIQRGMDGTEENPIRLIADPEAKTRPVIDFEKRHNGLVHGGDYWYFYGFDVTGSANMQKGFQVSGNHNILDQINTYENGNTGIQICRLSGSDLMPDWPAYNLVLNCTSYRNYDGGFEDADGFAAKLTVGEGNVFDGCIAYNNADDGWDLYAKSETGSIGAVTIRNCISYENGFVPGAGSKTGNGNGFKMGGESLSGKHVIENSIAFNNLMKGIDCNSCPDIIVKDCVSFNNGSHNYAFYTNNVANTDFKSHSVISFRTEKLDVEDNLKGKGNQVAIDYVNESTYYWNVEAGKAMNGQGVAITADMFVSLVFDGWERNADGSINLKGFLEIKSGVPENLSNAKLGGMASYKIELIPDEQCSFSKAWNVSNNVAHWHYCECGNRGEITAHDFIEIIDKPQVGTENGKKHQECLTCGYKKASITIYPEEPEVNLPVEPEIPDDGNVEVDPPKLNFFQRIWQAIINFFRNLFGIKQKD